MKEIPAPADLVLAEAAVAVDAASWLLACKV